MEQHRAKSVGRGVELPWPLWACHSPGTSVCSPTQKLSETLQLRFSTEAQLCRHDRLKDIDHWCLKSFFSPSSPRVGGGAESFNLLITYLVPVASAPHPKSHLISTNSDIDKRGLLWLTKDPPLPPVAQEIPRVLGALCQALGMETKHVFLISQYHTGHGIILCATFRETAKLFSTAVGLLCVPPSSLEGLQFPYSLTSTCYFHFLKL